MNVLITGSTGMVGTNLISAFASNKRYKIFTPNRKELNLLDRISVQSYIKKIKPDLIIHLAGKVGGIKANLSNQLDFFTENTLMGMNVVLSALESGVKNFLNIASSCMYPRDMESLSEQDILTASLEPTNEGYALAKLCVLKLCEYISNKHQLNYKSMIPCNLYGPHDNFDVDTGHMIAAVINKIHIAKINNDPQVKIWGDGTARREFMYVGDLADFIVNSVDKLNVLPQNLNVGLGYDYSINDYYKAISKIVGYKGTFVHDLSKPVGMNKKLLNINLAKSYGWHANTSLEEGINKTYNSYLSNLDSNKLELIS